MKNSWNVPEELRNRSYFFDNGIFFRCRRCGHCCTGTPGVVRVNASEIAEIARFLSLAEDRFISEHLVKFEDGFSIREDGQGRCLFFNEGCAIYPVRPRQCKTYPFWFNNLRSFQNWSAVVAECPGIGEGRLFSKEEILQLICSN